MCGDERRRRRDSELPAAENASERTLFTWYHAPPPRSAAGPASCICPPLGYESMSSYRALRILAQRLAALGFDTLRLDYDGTGNSGVPPTTRPGSMRGFEPSIAPWPKCDDGRSRAHGTRRRARRSTSRAASRRSGRRGRPNRVVESVSSGRAYIRELTAMARLSAQDDVCDDDAETGINAEGYHFTPETVAELTRWTLRFNVPCQSPDSRS